MEHHIYVMRIHDERGNVALAMQTFPSLQLQFANGECVLDLATSGPKTSGDIDAAVNAVRALLERYA